ncbi:DUF4231 domain-containing protein [Robiginitalea sp. M366]|uniref:DUF4231 domain-containing protein n=1 Tax=Robiginitalea aestuariiviva TaxID=3036903 RepID=UPI00240E55CD|nr:DUF4231 domain-containing protein [Robiginitalea aestuariiviva]MDG1571170.1 DUF4231 domain-containing protein [Robiginitalea aestuariiviva]
MTVETYMSERVDDQIRWYGKKSARNKKLHIWSSGGIILFSSLIPFFTGIDHPSPIPFVPVNSQVLAGLLGVLTATLTGITALMKFQEKWATYRITCEALQREKFLFQTATAPYQAGAAAYPVFVTRIEQLLGEENQGWRGLVTTTPGQEA